MKQLLLNALVSLFFEATANAQWVQQTLIPGTASNLNSIHCIHADTCFTAGNSTTVRKTVNGGTNWSVVNTPGFTNKSSVKMYNKNKILIGQVNGTFLRTIDGTNWTNSTGNTTHTIYDIFFHTDSNIIAVGGNPSNQTTGGHVTVITANAGSSWSAQNISGLPALFGIHCFNNTVCVASAGAETIYKTTDNGANWTVKHSGATASLFDIHFPTSSVGYAVGGNPSAPATGGIAFKTTDAGETWNALTLPFPNTLYGVHFTGKDTGYVVGNGGIIRKTFDGGASWYSQTSPVTTDLNKIYFANDSTGYISGNNGVILKTTNRGGTATAIGVQEYSEDAFIVFSDPSHPSISIKTNFQMNHAQMVIFNILGQQKESKENISGDKVSLNTSSFASGIYFFRLTDEGIMISGKFIVN